MTSNEPLRNLIGLGLLHVGEAGLDAIASHLIDEVVGEVLAGVIHPQQQPRVSILRVRKEGQEHLPFLWGSSVSRLLFQFFLSRFRVARFALRLIVFSSFTSSI